MQPPRLIELRLTLRFDRRWLVAAPLLVAVAVAVPLALRASTVGSLTSFTNGTVASAAEVNGNIVAVKTAVDDNATRLGELEQGPGFIKLMMSADQAVNDGTIVAFNSTAGSRGLTRNGNGVNLKAGVTYRLEGRLNIVGATDSHYVGYRFSNGTTEFGARAYSQDGVTAANWGFNASLLEFYTPSSDMVVYIKVDDDHIGTGSVTSGYNTHFAVTEMQ